MPSETQRLDLTREPDDLHGPDELPYVLHEFPDGQQHVSVRTEDIFEVTKDVLIVSRMTSWLDVEKIACAAASVREACLSREGEPLRLSLSVPYFLGARSDRRMNDAANYLKSVIAPVINSLGFDRVWVMDAHSYVLESVIDNLVHIEGNLSLINQALESKIIELPDFFIGPDSGAAKRIFDALPAELHSRVICCHKRRTGRRGEQIEIELPAVAPDRGCVAVVDDLCDGGRTFTELAALLDTRGVSKKFLVVTHGVFSRGLTLLGSCYNKIVTTNSVYPFQTLQGISSGTMIENETLRVMDVFSPQSPKRFVWYD